jgi:hypothetical protein
MRQIIKEGYLPGEVRRMAHHHPVTITATLCGESDREGDWRQRLDLYADEEVDLEDTGVYLDADAVREFLKEPQ